MRLFFLSFFLGLLGLSALPLSAAVVTFEGSVTGVEAREVCETYMRDWHLEDDSDCWDSMPALGTPATVTVQFSDSILDARTADIQAALGRFEMYWDDLPDSEFNALRQYLGNVMGGIRVTVEVPGYLKATVWGGAFYYDNALFDIAPGEFDIMSFGGVQCMGRFDGVCMNGGMSEAWFEWMAGDAKTLRQSLYSFERGTRGYVGVALGEEWMDDYVWIGAGGHSIYSDLPHIPLPASVWLLLAPALLLPLIRRSA